VDIAKRARLTAGEHGADTILLDTAGRLHVDEALMNELKEIKAAVSPNEILFVADAMTGQEAVTVASTFNEYLDLTGVVLTKMEGDARGGAALSIKAVVDRPLKYVGVGEKLDALEPFHPQRVASRILGMGDVLSLIEKAQDAFDEDQAEDLARKIKKDEFTLEDFQKQIRQLKKMGSMESLLGMIPGLKKIKALKDMRPDDGEMKRVEAIINSMTRDERRDHTLLNASRRRRIAKGSGTSVAEVNALIKNFVQTKKMMKKFAKGGQMPGLGKGSLPF
jgi:signal recognition particle subunit SRP54